MAALDAEALADNAVLLGLITREDLREAREEAEDGSGEALARVLSRKGLLTSWQMDRLNKGELSGYFFGGCKVLFHIAEGTFARVYRGRKQPGNQSVAIKVLRRRFTSDPAAVARFNQEAEAGLKLVHPNIVQIYDYGEQDKNYYMTMEYVEGSNLRDFLKLRQRIGQEDALPLMIGLAAGLQYSISRGVTHRDIKGTNILIGSRGVAKLVDFGLATLRDDSSSVAAAHGQRTVDYSALERTCGSPKGDPRSDIYFLGCVFYQMLTGNLPLPEVEASDPLAKMLKRSFGAIKPLSEHRLAPHPELTRIIEKMMKMDLKSRYQTMEEVHDDLVALRDSGALHAPVVAPSPAPVETLQEPVDDFLDMFAIKPPAPPSRAKPVEEPDLADFEVKAVAARRRILCVEHQPEIQEAFRKSFTKQGYQVVLARDAEAAVESHRESAPDVLVYDADGLGEDAIASFVAMHQEAGDGGRDLAAVVLLGPKQKNLIDQLPAGDRIVVLTKPIKMKDVHEALALIAPTED
jgi:CheY-like chemotaxis protein